ncbi:hypothetical protein Syun_010787 [Stephania yunnanensis]|uniref:Uncharacterized protein n=1 Tax=Stephania yunnanensis TaxID=152371 RepID=A0AAP0KIP7_9MAGN
MFRLILSKSSTKLGITKRLIKKALTKATSKNRMTYVELVQRTPPRRQFHDDISVIVLFLDHKLAENSYCRVLY